MIDHTYTVMKRSFFSILFASALVVVCFGQSSYRGLTPGTSNRIDAERVLGQPLKSVSKTLVEFKSPEALWKLYVQYGDESPAAIVDRIERTCLGVPNERCRSAVSEISSQLEGVLEDVFSVKKDREDGGTFVRYYGAPRFIVSNHIAKGINYEVRLAYYSEELYESAVPKSGCTGTIFGTWESDRGRMIIQRVGDNGVQGTYSKNNGTFSLLVVEGGYQGTWKDKTGTGEMTLLHNKDTFGATWAGPGARVPSNTTQKPSVESKEREEMLAKLGALIGNITKSGDSAAIGPINTPKPSLRDKGLPPGQPWNGKCVP